MSNAQAAVAMFGMAIISFIAGMIENSIAIVLVGLLLMLVGNWQLRLSKREGDGG